MKPVFNITLAIVLLTINESWSQKTDDTPDEIFKGDLSKIFTASKLYWYGLDFGKMKFTDEKKTDGEFVKKVLCPGWIDFFYNAYPEQRISNALKNDTIYFAHEDFQADQIKSIDPKTICDYSQNEFNYSLISDFVNNYKLPTEHEGVGFVIIVENFTKIYKAGTYFMTFFNIKSREVLWVYKIIMFSGGHGYIEHWGNPTYKSFHVFQNDFYKKYYRKND